MKITIVGDIMCEPAILNAAKKKTEAMILRLCFHRLRICLPRQIMS